jgi:hypothetical protein
VRLPRPAARGDQTDRRDLSAGASVLLNARWHRLRGSASPRRCPVCDHDVVAADAVHDGGELYHLDCALYPR